MRHIQYEIEVVEGKRARKCGGNTRNTGFNKLSMHERYFVKEYYAYAGKISQI